MSNPADPFEFVKQLWGQMAVPGFGLTGGAAGAAGASVPQMPSFDPKDLEKRLAELKQVKQWLEMNLNVMGLQINTIEMQLAAMTGFKDASDKMFGDPSAFAGASANTVGGSASSAGGAANGAAGAAAPWMDPQAWMTYMQTQAASMQQAAQQAAQKAMHDGAAAMQSAPRGAAAKAKPAAKKSARTRKST